MNLTQTQKKLLDFIHIYKNIHGYMPTQSECAEYFGVTQPAISKLFKKIKKYI